MSLTPAVRRIKRDLDKIISQEDAGMLIDFDESNIFNISALMSGPEGTPWEGGEF